MDAPRIKTGPFGPSIEYDWPHDWWARPQISVSPQKTSPPRLPYLLFLNYLSLHLPAQSYLWNRADSSEGDPKTHLGNCLHRLAVFLISSSYECLCAWKSEIDDGEMALRTRFKLGWWIGLELGLFWSQFYCVCWKEVLFLPFCLLSQENVNQRLKPADVAGELLWN